MNKPTGLFASLPAAFSDAAGKKGLTWFYYDEKKPGDGSCMSIGQVAVADEALNCHIQDSDWTFDLEKAEEALAELSFEEYYELLEKLFENELIDPEAMRDLLSKALSPGMLKLYQKVIEYAIEELKNVITDQDTDTDTDKEKNVKKAFDELLLQSVRHRV
jgi:hypothetical protein